MASAATVARVDNDFVLCVEWRVDDPEATQHAQDVESNRIHLRMCAVFYPRRVIATMWGDSRGPVLRTANYRVPVGEHPTEDRLAVEQVAREFV